MPTSEDYDIGEAFEAIENELISSMIRNMKRHKVEEADEEKQWEMWQALQLEALEKYKKDNATKYGRQFKDINRKIESLIRIANQEGMMDQEIEILKRIKDGFKGLKKAAPEATAEFFKLNDRKLNALIKATTSDMEKAERAILRMSNDKYRKIIYNAQVYANTGAGTYEKAVDMAAKDFLSAGINCVEYKNGSRHSVQEYASMALRTASKRAYLQGEGTKRQEWGISTVIVNKRGNPCPLCLPFVGKVFIDDVWSGGSRKDGPYPLLSSAMDAGLYHPNCRDSHTTYFPGISTPPDKQTFTEQDIEKAIEVEKAEQKESHARKQEERMERLAKNSLDPDNRRIYQSRADQWGEKKYAVQEETKQIEKSIESINFDEKYSTFFARVDLRYRDTSTIDKADHHVKNTLRKIFKGYRPAELVEGDESISSLSFIKKSNGKYTVSRHVVNTAIEAGESNVNIGNSALANSIHERIHDVIHQLLLKRAGINEEFDINVGGIHYYEKTEKEFYSEMLIECFDDDYYNDESVQQKELVERILNELEKEISPRARSVKEALPEAFVMVLGAKTPSKLSRKLYNFLVKEWNK